MFTNIGTTEDLPAGAAPFFSWRQQGGGLRLFLHDGRPFLMQRHYMSRHVVCIYAQAAIGTFRSLRFTVGWPLTYGNILV